MQWDLFIDTGFTYTVVCDHCCCRFPELEPQERFFLFGLRGFRRIMSDCGTALNEPDHVSITPTDP